MDQPSESAEDGASFIEAALVACFVAIFASVTVPNFFGFVGRQRQREARQTLLDFYTGARAHFLTRGTYACGACGVVPGERARYTYDFGDGRLLRGSLHDDACAARATAYQAAGGYHAVASAALDGGRRCEVWAIDEAMRLVHGPEAERPRAAGDTRP